MPTVIRQLVESVLTCFSQKKEQRKKNILFEYITITRYCINNCDKKKTTKQHYSKTFNTRIHLSTKRKQIKKTTTSYDKDSEYTLFHLEEILRKMQTNLNLSKNFEHLWVKSLSLVSSSSFFGFAKLLILKLECVEIVLCFFLVIYLITYQNDGLMHFTFELSQ